MANRKLRQEICLVNRTVDVPAEDPFQAFEEKLHIDRTAYNGPLRVGIEQVGLNEDAGWGFTYYQTDQSGYYGFATIQNSGWIWEVVRDDFHYGWAVNDYLWSQLPEGTSEIGTNGSASATGTQTGRNFKIFFVQDASRITRTKACFNVGVYENFDYSDTAKHAATYPKVWKYESGKFDPTPVFTFAVVYEAESTMDSVSFILEESSDAAFTSPTDKVTLSGLASATAVHVESTSFTPTNGYFYRVACQQSGSMKGERFFKRGFIQLKLEQRRSPEHFLHQ